MTEKQKTDAENIKNAHDVDAVRVKYNHILGRDGIHLVMWHVIVKLILKAFSWSAWWAIHGTYTVDNYVQSFSTLDKSGNVLQTGEMSWLPFAYAVCAWINFLLRPQFKRLVEAVAKALENWKK